jgi:predicted PurR-regulated permease PerM
MLTKRLFILVIVLIAFIVVGTIIANPLYPKQQEHNQTKPNTDNNSTEPKMNKNCKQKSNGGAEIQKSKNYRERFITFVTENDKFIIAISTVCIAIFTLTLFVATWLLWYSASDAEGS